MIHATAWMNLVNMLSERTQTQEVIYYMILFVWNVYVRQIYRNGKQISSYLGLGVRVGNGECLIMGVGVLFVVIKCSKIVMMLVQLCRSSKKKKAH